MFGLQTVCFFSSLLILAWCQNNTSTTQTPTGPTRVGFPVNIRPWDPVNDVPFFEPATPQIIGGQDAVYGEHPYQCRLITFTERFTFSCGAVIYNERTIVTAAHCVDFDPDTVVRTEVRCGVNVLSAPLDEFEVHRNVVKKIPHPDFVVNFGVGVPYDVAVLHIESPLVFNDFVRPVPLYDGVSRIPRDCVLTGWGRTSNTSGQSDVLQKTTARYVTRARCQRLWDEIFDVGVTDMEACFIDLVGPSAPTNPSCSGDSGGPAVCGGVLVGLTSWGAIPCEVPYPVVYTAIAPVKTWIEDNALTALKRSTVVG